MYNHYVGSPGRGHSTRAMPLGDTKSRLRAIPYLPYYRVLGQTGLSERITKTRLYNFNHLKPDFYIVKLGFTGVYIIFLIFVQKHRLWNLLEPPRRGGSNEYTQSIFWAEIRNISGFFIWKFSIFLVVKFAIYLNRRVFVMDKKYRISSKG